MSRTWWTSAPGYCWYPWSLTTDHQRADLLLWKVSQVNVNDIANIIPEYQRHVIFCGDGRTIYKITESCKRNSLGSKCSRIIFSFLRIISTCNWFETIICLDFLSSLAVDHWTFNQTLSWDLRNWECSVTGGSKSRMQTLQNTNIKLSLWLNK